MIENGNQINPPDEKRARFLRAGEETVARMMPKIREANDIHRDLPPGDLAAMVIESSSQIPNEFLEEAQKLAVIYGAAMTMGEFTRNISGWSLNDIGRNVIDARAQSLALVAKLKEQTQP